MRKKSWCLITLAVGAVSICGCKKTPPQYYSFNGFALGTSYSIIVETSDTTGLQREMERLFEETNASMSLYQTNSLLNRLNRNETDRVDQYIARCIEIAAGISELTGGEYDITIKPLTEAWGFAGEDPTYHPNTDSLLQYVGYKKIRIENGRLIKEHPRMQIDLNSVAKGLIVDLMGELLTSRGASNYMVEIGGEVVCRGINRRGTDWTIGIDRPQDGNFSPGENIHSLISITDAGMATSGNYRKFYIDPDGRKVVHTINAVTGQSSPSNLLSATVIAPDCATADALGTACMAVGLERAKEIFASRPELMGLLIYSGENGEYLTYVTDNLQPHIIR